MKHRDSKEPAQDRSGGCPRSRWGRGRWCRGRTGRARRRAAAALRARPSCWPARGAGRGRWRSRWRRPVASPCWAGRPEGQPASQDLPQGSQKPFFNRKSLLRRKGDALGSEPGIWKSGAGPRGTCATGGGGRRLRSGLCFCLASGSAAVSTPHLSPSLPGTWGSKSRGFKPSGSRAR